ncbi:MAG: hypothetical protein KDA24_23875 [Deltaproteobacteria bacterium]|nr:hypothetical protein [Deltaproteobacteria bacterium]
MRSDSLYKLAALGTLGASFALTACPAQPYFEEGPPISSIEPDWENGNVGGALVLGILADPSSPTEDEVTNLVEPRLVRINGDFSACADASEGSGDLIDKEVRVVVGNRNATVWSSGDGAVDVLTPVGPIRGGVVGVRVACRGVDADGNLIDGISIVEDAYDYYLGNVNADGTRPDGADQKRMEPLFTNEFGSFSMFYQAEPFASLPDASGYGYFFSEQSPRSSMFWGQNPDMVYGGNPQDYETPLPLLPQIPQLNYETPEQGDRLEAGEAITFFHAREHSNPVDPVRVASLKRISPQGFPEPDLPTAPNNTGVWLKFLVDAPGGGQQDRYLRVAQNIGQWCADPSRAGCDDESDSRINDTRIPIDPSFSLVFPGRPTREHLEDNYPAVVPEYLAFLDCNDDAACEDEVGVMIPSGTYDEVEIIKTSDEDGQWPWQDDEGFQGLRVTLERVQGVVVTEGAKYVDFPADVTARWPYNEEGGRYDNFDVSAGEGGFPMGVPLFVSYPGAFSQGERIPPKNHDASQSPPWTYPTDEDGRVEAPEPGSSAYDEFPYIEIPELEIETMLFAGGGAFSTYGFPVQVPLDPESEDGFDWRLPLPGGAVNPGIDVTGDGDWEDTYFVLSMTIRQIEGPGGFGGGPWKVSAFAWPGDDYIIIPRETLLSLPRIADAFRPDTEDQVGTQYLGSASLEIHRLARWNLSTVAQQEAGAGFRVADANVMFDVNAISIGYFHTENSCTDGIDNDGDGQIDASDTNCARADETYESGQCQDEEDNDEDGFIDAEDTDCLTNGVYDPTDIDEGAACSDLVDNDGDGWTDFVDANNDGIGDPGSDPGCVDAQSSSEGGFDAAFDCNDGIDSDFDGLIDRDDPGCEKGDDPSEEGDTCSDGLDNNGDGWIDADDLSCRPGRNGSPTAWILGTRGEVEYTWIDAIDYQCSDSQAGGLEPLDNDGDGLINADDPDCSYGWDPSGEVAPTAECSDRIDNDGDGWIDWPSPDLPDGGADPDCISANHPEGGAIPGGTCNDNVDNDNDGWIDADDPVCLSGADNETIVPDTVQYSILACNNNVDDDEDGDVDSDDADCVSGKDNSEAE